MPTTMSLPDLWKAFRLITDPVSVSEKDKEFLCAFLAEEHKEKGTETDRVPHEDVGDQKDKTLI